jgi:UDP-N-acetylmuramate--alanine ligase
MGRHVHFIGIGGTGLSAIATVLLERGETISGSDRNASAITRRLEESGMTVYIGHHRKNISGADLVIRSSAIRDDNVEVQAARLADIPVLKRADFLPYLTDGQRPIAVAGTHGKTTTTALITWLLYQLGQDPSYVIGSVALNLDKSAHAGTGDYFVIEADEYDRMFLGLKPWIAIVTNVEHDHPDCYPTPADFQNAFEAFVSRLAQGGALIANIDNPGSASLLTAAKTNGSRSFTYSLRNVDADYYAGEIFPESDGGFIFDLFIRGKQVEEKIHLKIPGLHNVSNALAALAVIDLLDLPSGEAARACETFQGTGRRFELRGNAGGVSIIDDYAHHPTEIRATLAAARARYPGRRIWAVWQPHTFSRTRVLLREFSSAFQDADKVLVTEVFAAREKSPVDGFSGLDAAQAVSENKGAFGETVFFEPTILDAVQFLAKGVQSGDVVLILSAGDADQVGTQLIDRLKETQPYHGANYPGTVSNDH